ncbi:hypothetical protein QR680_010799 [Steinernema hermaphroditum]|uniref:Peptidase A1 domain-containing protein n=1 Tax=Steinernema hermaphroditum TaxID=289476 RepID=A0AA39IRN0_9BILA|nr:hypothetical protein QR680_010799 [Steinernema hermaphroditum]
MLMWFVLLGLVLLCSSFAVNQRNKHKANIRVHARNHLPKKAQEAIYHHYSGDEYLLSTELFVGRENFEGHGFILDTLSGEMEMSLCPTANSTKEGCYHYQHSPTYININDHLAMETFKGEDIDDHWMYNLTFVKSKRNHLGFGWPSLKRYPQATFFPYAYFHQKPALRRFELVVAKDGCEGSYKIGAICDEYQEYPTYMVPTTSRSYWQFGFYGLTLGNYTTKFNGNGVIASTSAYIGMPKKYLNILVKQINATWDDEYGGYTQWCYGKFPDLELQLDNVVLKITPDQYLYTWQPLPNGKCIVNFEDSAANGFGPEWYFGLPLLGSYCVGFDYDFGTLGFLYNDWVAGDTSCHQ